jgi:hypothetical protein
MPPIAPAQLALWLLIASTLRDQVAIGSESIDFDSFFPIGTPHAR